jgi:hypothetical protein
VGTARRHQGSWRHQPSTGRREPSKLRRSKSSTLLLEKAVLQTAIVLVYLSSCPMHNVVGFGNQPRRSPPIGETPPSILCAECQAILCAECQAMNTMSTTPPREQVEGEAIEYNDPAVQGVFPRAITHHKAQLIPYSPSGPTRARPSRPMVRLEPQIRVRGGQPPR